MNPTIRLALRGAKFMAIGALTAAFLGLITFLPGELVATADQPGGASVSLPLAWGVCWACGRVGSVVGLIFFIIRRTLMGEVADPREAMTFGATSGSEATESILEAGLGSSAQPGLHGGAGR